MYMKTKNLLIALTMTTAMTAMSACSNNENEPQVVDITKPIEIDFGIGQAAVTTQTRMTPATPGADGQTDKWASTDQVSVTIVSKTGTESGEVSLTDNTYKATTTFEMNGSWALASSAKAIYWQDTQYIHTFYAYYPTSANLGTGSGNDLIIGLPTDNSATPTCIDNSTLAKLNECNILFGKASMKATTSVEIGMSHSMSQIYFTVEPGDGYNTNGTDMPTIASAEILNASGLSVGGTFDPNNGKVTADAAVAGAKSIKPYRKTGNHWFAVVMPGQTFSKGKELIRFTTNDGTTYTYTLDTEGDITCAANKSYNFTLKLNKKSVTLGSFNVAAWDKEDKTGGAGMDIQ